MALQDGILKFKGQMGDISFYKTKDGYAARRKGGIDANRLKTDPAFQRTRENGAEFGSAGTAAKNLRTAFRKYLLTTKDSRMSSRLTAALMKVIQGDRTSARGERNPVAGDLSILKGFEFNESGKLVTTFLAPYATNIDRAAGTLAVNIPSFVPADLVNAPEAATHLKLVMVAAEIDFQSATSVVATAELEAMPIGVQQVPDANLSGAVTAGSTHPLFLVLGIQFSQLVNGAHYPLKNGAFNALSIIEVNRA